MRSFVIQHIIGELVEWQRPAKNKVLVWAKCHVVIRIRLVFVPWILMCVMIVLLLQPDVEAFLLACHRQQDSAGIFTDTVSANIELRQARQVAYSQNTAIVLSNRGVTCDIVCL